MRSLLALPLVVASGCVVQPTSEPVPPVRPGIEDRPERPAVRREELQIPRIVDAPPAMPRPSIAPSPSCLLGQDWHGVPDAELDDVMSTWTVDGATVVDIGGDQRVAFDAASLCAGNAGITQGGVFVPQACDGFAAAHFTRWADAGGGGAQGMARLRVEGQTLPFAYEDAPLCLGDAVFGREVEIEVAAVALGPYIDEATCASSFAHLTVGAVDFVALEGCPAPGEVVPLERWRTMEPRDDGDARIEGTAVVLEHDAICDRVGATGPSGGTLSIPSSFSSPAVVISGSASLQPAGRLEVGIDDTPLAQLRSLEGSTTVCLPPLVRGSVRRLEIWLDGHRGLCGAGHQLVQIDDVSVIDASECARPLIPSFDDPTDWTLEESAEILDGALHLSAPSPCRQGRARATLEVPADGSVNALAISYEHSGTGTLRVTEENYRVDLPVGGSSAIVCLDRLLGSSIAAFRIELGESGVCDDGTRFENFARIDSIEGVYVEGCGSIR